MENWPLRLMVYGAGEAIQGSGALAPQIQQQLASLTQVCTNPVVAATAQLDASERPTQRLVLDPSGRQPVLSLPNVNVGDPINLLDFVRWSANLCPADRAVLVLSGHGAAWQDSQVDALLSATSPAARRSVSAVMPVPGALHHPRSLFGAAVNADNSINRALLVDGHSRDYLSNAELGAVCDKITMEMGRVLDVIVFDACLMSSWEILYELRAATATVVASVDELSAAGIPLYAAAAQFTVRGGTLAPPDLAKTVVDAFVPQTDFDSCVAVHLAAPTWNEAQRTFTDCCEALLVWLSADAAHATDLQRGLALAATSLVQFSSGGLADVGSLLIALGQLPEAPIAVTAAAQATAAALKSCVLARNTGRDYQRAMGISIFSPLSRTAYRANRSDYSRLQFPTTTGWLAVLDAVYGDSASTGPSMS